MKHRRKLRPVFKKIPTLPVFTVATAIVGAAILLITQAATSTVSREAEQGNRTGKASQISDGAASGGSAVRFGSTGSVGGVEFRNSNPMYTTQPGVASSQLDLSKLLTGQTPQFEFFKSNATPTGEGGQFRAWCTFSHLSNDDSIVYPRQPGAAHLHMYYGNVLSNAYSTSDTILNSGGSTCDGQEANRTSYWFPTMFDTNGKVRIPNQMILYYKNEGIPMPAGGYTAIPPGIKMLAGNSKTLVAQPHAYNDGFACGGGLFTNPTYDIIPACNGATNKLSQKILFPRCWDGLPINFGPNTADDSKHVVYPSGYHHGDCPASHPKVFAEISILFEWELYPNETTAGWYLSSDHNHTTGQSLPGGTTRHGDYIAGWNQTVVDTWTRDCMNTQWNCQTDFVSNKINTPFNVGGKYAALNPTDSQLFAGKGPIIK